MSSRTWNLGRWNDLWEDPISRLGSSQCDSLVLSGRSQQQAVWLLRPAFSPATGCLARPLTAVGSLTASGGCHSNKQFFINPKKKKNNLSASPSPFTTFCAHPILHCPSDSSTPGSRQLPLPSETTDLYKVKAFASKTFSMF